VGRWAGGAFAAERARSILESERLAILRPGLAEEHEAVPLLEKYADQRVSFTDCVSFVLMRRHGIERAFSFDRHFGGAGFRHWP
jgi:predicted nucleic acid-binding protein